VERCIVVMQNAAKDLTFFDASVAINIPKLEGRLLEIKICYDY
jgi:hypothetical protein